MSTLDTVLRDATAKLSEADVVSPRSEARILAAHVLDWTVGQVFARGTTEVAVNQVAAFNQLVNRRAAGEPLAYILGEKEFWGLPFAVDPTTLIPRPDTETVIELALSVLCDRSPARILDIGTGSGCLIVALLTEFPLAIGVATDIEPGAVEMACLNADRNGVADRLKCFNASWAETVEGPFDLVVSNPPYIEKAEIESLAIDVRTYEPRAALDGGEDGLNAYRMIFTDVDRLLTPNGLCIVEFGMGQGEEVAEIAKASGLTVVAQKKDLAGLQRTLAFSKKGLASKRVPATVS